MRSTSKYYERVQIALSNEILSNFTLRFIWEPETGDICPSSVAKYFSDGGYEVNLMTTKSTIGQEYRLSMPLLGIDDDKLSIDELPEFYATPHELVEYCGMLALSCNFEKLPFLNSWQFGGRTKEIGTTMILQINGFFSCHLVERLTIALK